MYFKIGDKVLLKNLNEAGTVVSPPDIGMVQVELDNGETIPVFLEDLIAYNPLSQANVPISAPKQKFTEDSRIIEFPVSKHSKTGLWTAFIPKFNQYDEILYYTAYLLNDSKNDIVFEIEISTKAFKLRHDNILKQVQAFLIGRIEPEMIESQLTVVVSLSDYYTSGPENKRTQSLRITPKKFFSRDDLVPFFDQMGYLFEFIPDVQKVEDGESLKDFTEKILKSKPVQVKNKPKYVSTTDPLRKSAFEPQIDLHAEKLLRPGQKLEEHMIMQLQMRVFAEYMEEAIRLGMDKVYIIHGRGNGKLKSAIARELRNNPYVIDFQNEYHNKYGFGATEVWLR